MGWRRSLRLALYTMFGAALCRMGVRPEKGSVVDHRSGSCTDTLPTALLHGRIACYYAR